MQVINLHSLSPDGVTTMLRLLYGSFSTLNIWGADDEVASIIRISIEKNAVRGVTGALVFTGTHFAQALEGDEIGVRELMTSICADSRHRMVTVVHEDHSEVRRFASWSMAYNGRASYVDKPIENLFDAYTAETRLRGVRRVYDLMMEFTNN